MPTRSHDALPDRSNAASAVRLTRSALATIDGVDVRLPSRRGPPPSAGVVHLGLGAFHRAHQAMVFDALLEQGDRRWAVFGVAMRSPRVAGALAEQGGLYSVQVSSAQARHWQVVGSIADTCVAADEPARVAAAIAASATRWITLTVTEKGYGPELAELIVRGLDQRRAAARQGLTIASCDNLSGNGDLLRALCLEAAATPELRRWIEARCAFPNSMVDRIVPAATARRREEARQALGVVDEAALATEAFWEWVLQDRVVDATDAAALRSVGVTVVDDVAPFEAAKLRLLNGSHSALACIGAVLGLATVAECVAQPSIECFLHRLMTEEVMPHLSRPGLPAYRDALLARFANPALAHSVHQIATDFSQKIPQRWVPSVLAQLRAGGSIEHLALVAAVWVRYCRGEDETGRSHALADPMASTLQALAQQSGDADAAVKALVGLASIWGPELVAHRPWQARVAHWLRLIRSKGVRAALQQANDAASRERGP